MRALFAMLCAAAIGVLTWQFGPAIAQTTFPNPVATVTTLTTSQVQIVAQNPTRRSIRICNTGATNGVWIWPGSASPPKSVYLIPPVASVTISCYTPPNGVVGSAGAQYNAGAIAGSGSVSVEEW